MEGAKIVLPMLDDGNYMVWSTRMRAALSMKGWSAAIDEGEPAENDNAARSFLLLHVKDHVLPFIRNMETARKMWEALESLHRSKSRARVNQLRREMAQLKKGLKEPVAKYISRAEGIRDQLLAAGDTLDTTDIISTVLNGLPSSYDTAVMILEAEADNREVLDLSDVLSRLLVHEQRLRKNDGPVNEAEASAFAGAGGPPSARPGQGGRPSDKSKTCFYCGKPGHIAKDCRKKKRDRAAGGHQHGAEGHSAVALVCHNNQVKEEEVEQPVCEDAVFEDTQVKDDLPDLVDSDDSDDDEAPEDSDDSDDEGPDDFLVRGSRMSVDYDELLSSDQLGDLASLPVPVIIKHPISLECHAVQPSQLEPESPIWLLDSGASHHITGNKDLISGGSRPSERMVVRYADGVPHDATLSGHAFLKTAAGSPVKLENVFYVPGARANLISLSTVLSKGGVVKEITASNCTIRKGPVTVTAKCQQGLYRVEGVYPPLPPRLLQGDIFAGKALGGGPTTAGLWHARYGHLGMRNMGKLVEKGMVTGIVLDPRVFKEDTHCEPCVLAKMHRSPFPESTSEPERGLIHSDLCGPLSPASLGGSRYILTVLEDSTKFSIVTVLKTKDQASDSLKAAICLIETQSGMKVKTLRTDRGGEFCNAELDGFLAEKGIVHQRAAPYSPQSNGAAERLNRTLLEKVRAFLLHSGAPQYLWAEALQTANTVRNLSPVSGSELTPYQMFTGKKPDVSFLRVWGCAAYAYEHKIKRRKLDAVSCKGVFVGYDRDSKAYRILSLDGNSIVSSRDVYFREDLLPFKAAKLAPVVPESSDNNSLEILLEPGQQQPPMHLAADPELASEVEDDAAAQDGDGAEEAADAEGDLPLPLPGVVSGAVPVPEVVPEDVPAVGQFHGAPLRRSSRLRKEPGEWWAATGAVEPTEPKSAREALSGPEAEQWRMAMDEEYEALIGNKTWELGIPPLGKTVVPGKWVLKRKFDADGRQIGYKARYVALGCRQREGRDYNEVYAPVGKHSTLRALLAVVAGRDLELHQVDVANAFLHADIEEEVWVQQPPEYEQKSQQYACRLRKTLYGLKQSPRAWYTTLKTELELIGFRVSDADPGLFIHDGKEERTFVLVHVDDILVAGSTDGVHMAKTLLAKVFKLKDLGPSSFYLRMDIHRDRETRRLILTQKGYVSELVSKYVTAGAKPKSTPLPPGVKLTQAGEPMDQSVYQYKQMIGSLMYLAVCTRPDIAQSVGVLARYSHNPTEDHLRGVLHVLEYLSGTLDYGICFGGGENLVLDGYTDADFAGDVDTRRSTTGYVFLLNGGAVSWASKVQHTVAQSTTEAEYMSVAAAVNEALNLKKLFPDLRIAGGPVQIYGDNQAAIKILKNPISCSRTKHIDVKYHAARERVVRGEVMVTYISTELMVADVMTKSLPKIKFQFCRLGMGVNNR